MATEVIRGRTKILDLIERKKAIGIGAEAPKAEAPEEKGREKPKVKK